MASRGAGPRIRTRPVEFLEMRTLLSVAFGPAVSTSDPNLLALIGQDQVADIDSDGKSDVVIGANTAGGTSSLTRTDVLLSTGAGAFDVQPGPAFPAASATSTNVFAVGDLNGDGKPDLIYASQSFGAGLNAVVTPELNTSTVGVASFAPVTATTIDAPANFNPQQIVTADFNGDGRLDVAILGLTGDAESIVVLDGNGAGAFTETYDAAIEVVAGTPLSDGVLLAGDFNGDGRTDLAVYDPQSGDVTFLRNTGSSFSQTASPLSLGYTGYTPGPVIAADLTADGKTDLIVGENSNAGGGDTVAVFVATGAGNTSSTGGTISFSAQTLAPAGNPAGEAIGGLVAADIDGDNHVDVATDYGVLTGNGTGVLESPTPGLSTSALAGTQGYTALLTGDLNADGRPDLIGVNQANHTVVAGLNASTAPVTLSPTTTTLAASKASITAGSAVTLTATVSGGTGIAGGYVDFLDDGTLLGSAALTDSGVASFATTTLGPGTQSLTASYLGSDTDAASTSSAIPETVLVASNYSGGTGGTVTPPTLPDSSVLHPSLAALKLPLTEVATQKIDLDVPVTVTNSGSATYSGAVTVSLYAADAAGFDGSQQLLRSQSIKRLTLRSGRSVTLRLRVTEFPATPIGTVHLLATVGDSAGGVTGAASATTTSVATPFAAVTTALTTLRSASSVVGGSKTAAFAVVTLVDTGNVDYAGRVSIALFGSTTKVVPDGVSPLNTITLARLGLRPNVSRRIRVALKVNPSAGRSSVDYILAQTTDAAGDVTTGPSATTITVAPPLISLAGVVTVSPATVEAGPRCDAGLLVTLTNNGNVTDTDTFVDTVTASTGRTGTKLSVQTGTFRTSIAVGHSRRVRVAIPTVSQLPTGSYLLTLRLSGSAVPVVVSVTTALPLTIAGA